MSECLVSLIEVSVTGRVTGYDGSRIVCRDDVEEFSESVDFKVEEGLSGSRYSETV